MDATPPPLPTLLLLPPPLSPATAPPPDRLVLNSTYRPPVAAALASVATRSRTCRQPVLLVIAVAAPLLAVPRYPTTTHKIPSSSSSIPPARSVVRWFDAQSLLAGIYSIIAGVCAEQGIRTDLVGSVTGTGTGTADDDADTAGGSVDTRVVLVNHERGRWRYIDAAAADGTLSTSLNNNNGTIVPNLAGFATCVSGPWEHVLHPSSEAGYELVRAFLDLAEGGKQKSIKHHSQVVAVPGGLSIGMDVLSVDGVVDDAGGGGGGAAADSPNGNETNNAVAGCLADKNYETVILGGTFDHLHLGHKLLLHGTALLLRLPEEDADGKSSSSSSSSSSCCTLIVGVSGDSMLRSKKFADELESWEVRCRSVLSFLATVFNTTPAAEAATTSGPPSGYRIEQVCVGDGVGGGDDDDDNNNNNNNNNNKDSEKTSSPGLVEMHGIYAGGAIRVRCTVLVDSFGPAVEEERIGAICVSGETREGGRAVNDGRAAKGWHALDLYEVDVLDSRGLEEGAAKENFTGKISSTAIRKQRAEGRAKARARARAKALI